MNEQVLILSAGKYDFVDDKSGKNLKGLTVWLMPIKSQEKENLNGIKPVKYSLPVEKMHIFDSVELPAYGTMHFRFDFSASKIIPDTFTDLLDFELGEI